MEADDSGAPDLGGEVRAAAEGLGDHIARLVTKAKVARELFRDDRPVSLGRFHLLDRVGSGGMGTVWGAWDPKLERRVAIKVLHPHVVADRDRILREGQALARLSHPNVIPIFECDVVDGQVYLVMEWVKGMTLRAFAAASRTTMQLVDAYRQACAGLAAAHRAGLIHRDFKPDNAIVGEDGRVRVLDFGLAIDAAAGTGSVAGTRDYMAPEVAAGGAVSPAVDQYAFCVSLREAFETAHRPRPRWVEAITVRGTAREPGARFGSMAELAAALGDDPARRWRRRGWVAAAMISVAIAFVVGDVLARPSLSERCAGIPDEIARDWSAGSRTEVRDHLRSLGSYGAGEADPTVRDLDDYARGWVNAGIQTCQARARGALSPAQYEQRVGCLTGARGALHAASDVLRAATPEQLPQALVAVRMLPSAEACDDWDLSRVSPPPDGAREQVRKVHGDIERARILVFAASPQAEEAATTTLEAADATHYLPVIARAMAVQGWVYRWSDRARAIELLNRAFHASLDARDDVLAVETYARARFVASRDEAYVPPSGEREIVEDLGRREGQRGRFALALLYNNLGTERLVASDRPGARALFRQALDTWQRPLGDRAHDLELIVILRNLALVEDTPARRVELTQQVAEETERELGAEHPDVINARIQAAVLTPDPMAAADAFARVCHGIRAWHDALRRNCAYDEGWLAIDRNDLATAASAMTSAHGDPAVRDPPTAARIAAAYLEVQSGEPARVAAAIAAMRTLAAEGTAAKGWWMHAFAADALVIVALGESAGGRVEASTQAWADALAVLPRQPDLERRRARAHAVLAQRLASEHIDEAREHARAAIAWYDAAGGYDAELGVLQKIEARHAGTN